MRSRCSSPRYGTESMEVERSCGLITEDQPHLSGAYIRRLVKQLSSSTPSGDTDPRDGTAKGEGERLGGEAPRCSRHQQGQKASPHRKQTRRRVCTSKPYQERLINMAEARREIVTALKFHRAAMKRASEQQQHLEHDLESKRLGPPDDEPLQAVLPRPPPPPSSVQGPPTKTTGGDTPGVCPSYGDNWSMLFSYFNSPSLPSTPNCAIKSSWPCDNMSLASLPIAVGNPVDLMLPSMPLGLNLNLQDFNSIDINLVYSSGSDPPMFSCISTTSSPSNSHPVVSPTATTSVSASQAVPSASSDELQLPPQTTEVMPKPAAADGTLHPAMDDEEIAEIQSIVEQHDMEWNDKLSLVTSAWWCNLLETMEKRPHTQEVAGRSHREGEGSARITGGLGSSNEVMMDDVIPYSWLGDQQQVAAHDLNCSEYLQDFASLPRLDVGKLEGADCEWL